MAVLAALMSGACIVDGAVLGLVDAGPKALEGGGGAGGAAGARPTGGQSGGYATTTGGDARAAESGEGTSDDAGDASQGVADADVTSTFACGDKICSASDYCRDDSGGMAPTHSYSCAPIPASCTALATCACVVPYSNDAGWVSGRMNICMDPGPGRGGRYGSCSDDSAGHVRVQCQQ
jgi:hypothetical protein